MYYGHSNASRFVRSLFVFIFCAGVVGLGASIAGAQSIPGFSRKSPAFIDDSFNPVLSGLTATGQKVLVQPDGKILVVGNFALASGVNKNGIARYNSDGTLDTSFNAKSGANGTINALALQSNGKIIIGGSFTLYEGQPVGNIARLNTNGSLDTDFNSNGVYSTAGAGSVVNSIAVTPSNQIYIGGSFTTYNGVTQNRLARLNVNGNIDSTFAVGTGPNSAPTLIKVTPSGSILITGPTTYNGTTGVRSMARINTDGTLDTTFNTNLGTGPSTAPSYIDVLPDNKIIIGGSFTTFNAVAKPAIARLNSDGTLDTTFDVPITNSPNAAQVTSIAQQPDGKLVLVGRFLTVGGVARAGIARISADGALDTTLDGGTGPVGTPSNAINWVALGADGKPVLTGAFSAFSGAARGGLVRLNVDGSLDTGMVPSLNTRADIFAITRHTDGKIFVAGTFVSANGVSSPNLAKLNADGSTDATFNVGTGPNGQIQGMGVQPDGKVIISGTFTQYNGAAALRIARINTDGTLDASFNVGTGFPDGGFNPLAQTIVVQPDGKVLVGGGFATYNGATANRIARLNSDGSVDATFNIGTGPSASATIYKIALQGDGKIIVAGDFSTFNGATKGRITRLNADGSNDATFDNGGTGFNSTVRDVFVQADGKLAVSGAFVSFNGAALTRVARLNSNGTRDTSFDPTGVFTSSDVTQIVQTPDGKYIVVGGFNTAAGLPKNRIARLRSNGSLDPKFVTGLGPAGLSFTLGFIVPHNGRYIIGGTFSSFNTSPRTSLVSISNTTKAPVDFDGDGKSDWAITRHNGAQTLFNFWINYNDVANSDQYFTFPFGIFGVDNIQPGDFDGDGMTDVAVWRGQVNGEHPIPGYWINFSSTETVKFIPFGLTGDRTVLEDYDGDGKDDMSVYRLSSTQVGAQGTWFYRGSLNNPNGNITYVPFGMRYGDQADQADDIYPGDFDGDGKADFRVQRRADITQPSSNTAAVWYTLTATGNLSVDYFGWSSDRGIPGDYDGDGKTDMAISRGFNITCNGCVTTWYIRYTSGLPDATFQWGSGGLDIFAQGDYDGDGITDPTVYRRAGENDFYVLKSTDQSMLKFHWGHDTTPDCGFVSCDVPVANYNNR